MKKKLLFQFSVGLVIIISLILFTILYQKRTLAFNGSIIQPPPVAPEINLSRADGRPFQLSKFSRKIVLLAFGYTNCPDVCPITLSGFKQVITRLADKSDQVEFVFITVDPENDTPEFLDTYVTNFHPKLIGLSGSLSELEIVWQDYGVAVIREEVLAGEHETGLEDGTPGEHQDENGDVQEDDHPEEKAETPDQANLESADISHSSRVYAIDKNGLMRLTFPFGIQIEAMVEDIEQLLKDR